MGLGVADRDGDGHAALVRSAPRLGARNWRKLESGPPAQPWPRAGGWRL